MSGWDWELIIIWSVLVFMLLVLLALLLALKELLEPSMSADYDYPPRLHELDVPPYSGTIAPTMIADLRIQPTEEKR